AAFSRFDPERAAAIGPTGAAALLPEVPQPPRAAARKGTQPSSGLIIQPEAESRTLEVVGWNTSAPEKSHNTSHAERQFIHWFEGRDRKWKDRVKNVNVIVSGRDICPLCSSDIATLSSHYPHVAFNW